MNQSESHKTTGTLLPSPSSPRLISGSTTHPHESDDTSQSTATTTDDDDSFVHVMNDNPSLSSSSASSSSSSSKNSTTTITIRQVQTESDAYGTGAKVWPASLVLVKYLEWTRDKWLVSSSSSSSSSSTSTKRKRRTTVVDLGAGTGVTSLGIALMLSPPSSSSSSSSPTTATPNEMEIDDNNDDESSSLVVCTDGCGLVVALAQENVQRVIQELTTTATATATASSRSADDGYGADGGTVGAALAETTEKSDTTGSSTSSIHPIVRNRIGTCEIRVKEYNWGDGTLNNELTTAETTNEHSNYNSTTNGGGDDDDGAPIKNDHHHHYDIILVSDCVLPKLYPIAPLVDAIDELSGPESVAYISYEERYYPEYDPKEYFRTLAEGKGLEVTVVPMEEQHPIYSVEDIEIWEVRRRKEE